MNVAEELKTIPDGAVFHRHLADAPRPQGNEFDRLLLTWFDLPDGSRRGFAVYPVGDEA